jgi:allosteric NADP-dependent malic enzyme (EC 1.1.1.40)
MPMCWSCPPFIRRRSRPKLVQALGAATLIGPILVGLEHSVQIVSLGASVNEILTAATFAAYEEGVIEEG